MRKTLAALTLVVTGLVLALGAAPADAKDTGWDVHVGR